MPYVDRDGNPAPNFKLKCDKHPGVCEKRRGDTVAFTRRHGRIECIAYLWAWYMIEWLTKPTKATHAQEIPTQAQIDAIVADHREALEDMTARLGVV